MAELELSVQYKTLPARIGLTIMGILLPMWALIIPFCSGLFLALVMQMPTAISPLAVAAVFSLMLLLPLLAVVLTAVCEDDRLIVSKEGLAFPLFLLPALRFRRERLWTDLAQAKLRWSGASNYEAGDVLHLFFHSGGRVSCRLRGFSKSNLEQLLLAIEVWGIACNRDPDLILFQNALQNEIKGIEQTSYTQMWEEELSRRFHATSFVPLSPGHRLQDGKLTILRQIAFGGLSAIYVGQLNGRELVVIKEAVIPANANEESRLKAIELFEREARLLSTLEHPQIARVSDHFAEDGRNYMMVEHIHGQDLRQLVKQNGAQKESSVLNWAKQICSIVDYLHEREHPIIHRDLTPDNLVLADDGNIKLIDFGAANEFVATATGTLVGKQAYISPEQFRGKAKTQSDIYSLGGTIYYLLTGKDPEALSQSHPKDLVPEVSDAVDELVARCTAMETSDRFASAKEVLRYIEDKEKSELAVGSRENS